jgi:hypothetical protein
VIATPPTDGDRKRVTTPPALCTSRPDVGRSLRDANHATLPQPRVIGSSGAGDAVLLLLLLRSVGPLSVSHIAARSRSPRRGDYPPALACGRRRSARVSQPRCFPFSGWLRTRTRCAPSRTQIARRPSRISGSAVGTLIACVNVALPWEVSSCSQAMMVVTVCACVVGRCCGPLPRVRNTGAIPRPLSQFIRVSWRRLSGYPYYPFYQPFYPFYSFGLGWGYRSTATGYPYYGYPYPATTATTGRARARDEAAQRAGLRRLATTSASSTNSTASSSGWSIPNGAHELTVYLPGIRRYRQKDALPPGEGYNYKAVLQPLAAGSRRKSRPPQPTAARIQYSPPPRIRMGAPAIRPDDPNRDPRRPSLAVDAAAGAAARRRIQRPAASVRSTCACSRWTRSSSSTARSGTVPRRQPPERAARRGHAPDSKSGRTGSGPTRRRCRSAAARTQSLNISLPGGANDSRTR